MKAFDYYMQKNGYTSEREKFKQVHTGALLLQ